MLRKRFPAHGDGRAELGGVPSLRQLWVFLLRRNGERGAFGGGRRVPVCWGKLREGVSRSGADGPCL